MSDRWISSKELLRDLRRATGRRVLVAMLLGVIALCLFGRIKLPWTNEAVTGLLILGVPLLATYLMTRFYCRRAVACPHCGSSLWRCGNDAFKVRRADIRRDAFGCTSCGAAIKWDLDEPDPMAEARKEARKAVIVLLLILLAVTCGAAAMLQWNINRAREIEDLESMQAWLVRAALQDDPAYKLFMARCPDATFEAKGDLLRWQAFAGREQPLSIYVLEFRRGSGTRLLLLGIDTDGRTLRGVQRELTVEEFNLMTAE